MVNIEKIYRVKSKINVVNFNYYYVDSQLMNVNAVKCYYEQHAMS